MRILQTSFLLGLCFACVFWLFCQPALADSMLVRLDSNSIEESGSITATYIIQACRKAEQKHAEYLIFDFDCSATKLNLIDRAAQEIVKCKSTTVAFIRGKCYGAPFFLALHCDLIFFKTSASISPFSQATQTSSELYPSYNEFLISALDDSSHNSRNQNFSIFFAKGEKYYRLLFAKDTNKFLSSEGITSIPQIGAAGIYCLVDSDTKDMLVEVISGKLLEPPKKIDLDFPLSTLHGKAEIELLGLDAGFVVDMDNLLAELKKTGKSPNTPILYEIGMLERFAEFLNHPVMLCLLLSFAFLAILLELKTPGTFIGAGLAIVFFAVFFFSNYICGTAGIIEFSIFLIGMLCLIVEITVIPGFGFVGAIGIAMLIYSLFASIIPGYLPGIGISPFDSYYYGLSRAGQALLTMVFSFVLLGIGGMILSRFLPGIPLLNRLVHTKEQDKSEFSSLSENSQKLLGMSGVALTDLRPTGKVEISGKRVEARSSGNFILKGTRVRVIDSDFGVQVEEY